MYNDDYDDSYDCYGNFHYEYDDDHFGYHDYDCDEFEDCNGVSALRKETTDNPRNQPCPTCGEKNMLTPKDVRLHYQCDYCADRLERGGY